MLNREQVLEVLMSLGLTETDSEVYLHLAMKGPQKGKDVAEMLNLYKQQLYRSLKRLQGKGMVGSTLERPARFSAGPLEKVLEFLIEAKKEQALALQANRKELLSSWCSLVKKDSSKS